MGLASKRRGGSSSAEAGSGSGAVRSSKGSGGRSKEKNSASYRSADGDRGIERGSSSRADRDGIDGGRSHGSSRGGARSRILARASAAKSGNASSGAVDTMPDAPRRRRPLDPALLARGMSARAIGARVSSHLKLVSSEDIEKDIRHMEAYRAACVAYSQQFFSYVNSDLVGQGVYGAIPIGPGVLSAAAGDYSADPNRRHRAPDGAVPAPSMSMPVRIDPEEEKRLSILRKKVAASEAEREVLETEYMSLRAHYVNSCHRLKRNRHLVDGQLELLRELVRRSGEVLALRRVRCAAAKDVLRCLEYRAAHASERRHSSDRYRADVECSDRMDVDEDTKQESNLAKVWTSIERQLREAEDSCLAVSTPHNVLVAKGVDPGDNDEDMGKGGETKTRDDDGEMSGNSSTTSQEHKRKAGKNDSGRAQGFKKGGSTSDEGSVSKNATGGGRRNKDNGETNGKTLDVNVIPWKSRMMAKAPHDVPLLLSLLSSAPDRTVAYGVDDILTNNETALCWINKNVPTENQPAMGEEAKELESLRREADLLKKTLDVEMKENREIQNKIIESRKRSDEMCAMMSMLRTETEAVLSRHNIILETPEARARARDLHKKAAEAAEAAAAAARAEARANKNVEKGREGEEEDLEVDDDGELAEPEDELEEELDEDGEMMEKDGDGETVTAEDDISQDDDGEVHEDDDVDDDEDQISFSDVKRNFKGHRTGESDSAEEGEIHEQGHVDAVHDGEEEEDEIDYEDDEEGEIHEEEHAQPLKEVIVRQDGDVNDREDGDINDEGDGDDHHNMGEYEEDEEEGEIREDGDDDEDWQREEAKEGGLNDGDPTAYDDVVDAGKSPRPSAKDVKDTDDGGAGSKEKKKTSRAEAMLGQAGNEDDEGYNHAPKDHARHSRLSDHLDQKADEDDAAAGALADLAGGGNERNGGSRMREEDDEEEEEEEEEEDEEDDDDDEDDDLGDDGHAAASAMGNIKGSFANHKRSLDEEDEHLVGNDGAARDQDSDGYSHVKKRRQV